MNIIKCMAEYVAEKSKHEGLVVTEELFSRAVSDVLEKEWEMLVKRYGDDIFGFFCLDIEWSLI